MTVSVVDLVCLNQKRPKLRVWTVPDSQASSGFVICNNGQEIEKWAEEFRLLLETHKKEESEVFDVWLVWDWRLEEGILIPCLRAIDKSQERAKAHKLALEHENDTFSRESKITIERSVANHLFGFEDLKRRQTGLGVKK